MTSRPSGRGDLEDDDEGDFIPQASERGQELKKTPAGSPEFVPWSNPNEVRARQKDEEEAFAIEEAVSLEEKDKIKGADPQNKSMSWDKDENFYKDKDEEEHVKCPPQHVPWSNPNEVQASQKDEKAVAMEEGLFLEEKDKVKGADPQNVVAEERIEIEHLDTSGDQRVVSSSNDLDASPAAGTVDTRVRHPAVARRTRIPQRTFPGAYREGGPDNEEEDGEDELTIQSHIEEPIPPTLEAEAELVNTAEEERRRQDDIKKAKEEALEDVRNNAVVAEVVSDRGRRWKFAVAFLLLILIVVGVVMGVTLTLSEPTTEPIDAFRSLLVSVSEEGLYEANSPQYKALDWIANKDPAQTIIGKTTEETIKERYVAAVLYFALGGESWIKNYNFLTGDPICSWNQNQTYGISCDQANRVVTFNMSKNGLSGSIPEEIGHFSDLSTIAMTHGMITGTLPSSLADLSHLAELDLRACKLVGTIPDFLYNHAQLTELLLDDNRFTGTIPSSLGTSPQLAHFWVANNKLAGSIPASVGQNSVLLIVDLSHNVLEGSIPEFSPSSQIEYLSLDNNTLYGSIPSSVGNLQNVQYILLENNQLGGTVPTELGKCHNLTYINFQLNQLKGDIGPVIDTLPRSLTSLDLSGNRFSGTVPTSVGTFTELYFLDLAENILNGAIPTELGLLSSLELLSLYSNRFNGTVPTSLASLTLLELLYLNDNDLTGSVDALCGIDIEVFVANSCEQVKINCTCCTYCCDGIFCNPLPS